MGSKERSLLAACFRSVFWLPPKEEIEAQHLALYFTVRAS